MPKLQKLIRSYEKSSKITSPILYTSAPKQNAHTHTHKTRVASRIYSADYPHMHTSTTQINKHPMFTQTLCASVRSSYSNERVSKKVQEIWGRVTETVPTCYIEGSDESERDGDVLLARRQNVPFL